MPAAELRVLGPVEVVVDGAAIALAAKQTRLLAVLVSERRACGIDELVEALWDGSAPASARKLVQVYVSQLRRALPFAIEIVTRQVAYAAELAPGVLDAFRFEGLLGEAQQARRASNPASVLSLASRALALWRGQRAGVELALAEYFAGIADELRQSTRERRAPWKRSATTPSRSRTPKAFRSTKERRRRSRRPR